MGTFLLLGLEMTAVSKIVSTSCMPAAGEGLPRLGKVKARYTLRHKHAPPEQARPDGLYPENHVGGGPAIREGECRRQQC